MFTTIKKAMQKSFAELVKNNTVLFITDCDREMLWNTYLDGFEDKDERQEHNCHCCRSFIKNYGNIVAIVDGKLVSIWNFEPTTQFEKSVKALNTLVINSSIRDFFVNKTKQIGTDSNVKLVAGASPIVWNHFSLILPNIAVNTSSSVSNESIMGNARDSKNVFKRSLDELTLDSVETVLELIAQNSLYRGEEFKAVLQEFLKQKKSYAKSVNKDNYCWANAAKLGAVAKIRNTSIGTLLIDLSEGLDLDIAVTKFEKVVAPTNYKRPTALVTKGMIEQAEKTINELGYANSLERRYATPDDVSIDKLLFVNRDAKKAMGIFAEMKEDVAINPKTLTKVEEIGIEDFLKNILPTAKGIQVLLENSHLNNLTTLITAKEKEAPILFKWTNPFSWSYTNAVTDSIKENVKAAGGKVDGFLRCSIQWNEDGKSIIDLDAHVQEPKGQHIYYGTYKGYATPMSGMLDIDMINPRTIGIENIFWTNPNKMGEGVYKFQVHNFSGHRNFDGVRCQVEMDGEIHEFAYNTSFTGYLDIADITYKNGKFTIKSLLEGKTSVNSKEKWNLSTNKFHKVSMIMNSPNHWDGTIGNKHTFFIVDGAKCDETPRGFFNEFLKEDLSKDRKVFEILGGKLKVESSDKQLSGIGFSSTQRNSVICKVEGKFDRMLKINF